MIPFRVAINDVGATTNTNAKIFPILRLALIQIFNDVPEVRIQDNGTRASIPEQFTALSDVVPLPEEYLMPAIDYSAYRYFLGDSGSARDEARAKEHLSSYNRFMNPQE